MDTKELTKSLVDQGLIVEAGWIGYRAIAVPPGASEAQITDMRNTFYAGAVHLFASIMTMADDDADVTETDMKRMNNIRDELDLFVIANKLRNMKIQGTG